MQEIDLTPFIKKIYIQLFNNIKVFKQFYAIGLIISLILFILFNYNNERSYTSNFCAKSYYLTNGRIVTMINDLNDKIKDKSFDQVSQMLKIDENKSYKISYIDANIIDQEDIEEFKDKLFEITLVTTDVKLQNELQESIVNYLSNNNFSKARIEKNKKSIIKNIEFIDNEIINLTKTNDLYQKILDSKSIVSSATVSDIGGISMKIVELKEKREQLLLNLDNLKEIIVIKDIEYKKDKYKKMLLLKAFIYMFSSIIIVFIISIIYQNFKKK